ncbi:Alcohol-forming fatty acyl-CoA reductase [Linum grandiflorum]
MIPWPASLLENKTIVVTGAAGFLGKVFVEEVLRVQPNVKKLYLLLRAPDSHSAANRVRHEVTEKEVFRVLKERWGTEFGRFISDKVVAVAGDVSGEDLGIKDVHLKQRIWEEVDVFLHSAATTAFDERYDVALGTNTLGASNVLSFSKKCHKIQLLIHVSTAYVCPQKEGIVLEKPYSPAGTTTEQLINGECELVKQRLHQLRSKNLSEKAIASSMQNLGLERARHYGWPNTYTLTKAMGEMIMLDSKGDLPVVILRPTMITSTLQHPFPGWIEGARTIDGFIVNYAKGRVKILVHGPRVILDLIPADMVVNAIIVAMGLGVAKEKKKGLERIYHLGSSRNNPIKVSDVHRFGVAFFNENPWIDSRNGKVVRPLKIATFTSMASFRFHVAVHFRLPLKVLGIWNSILCNKYEASYLDSCRKLKIGMRLIGYYLHYLLSEAVFDDTNLKKLRILATENDGLKGDERREELNLDTGSISWEHYFMNIHIPGLVKFVMKPNER